MKHRALFSSKGKSEKKSILFGALRVNVFE